MYKRQTQDRIIRGMVGRDLEHRFPERTPQIGVPVLEVRDWTVFHPTQAGRVIIDKASFTVRAGEVVGIAGLMGAGRTELAMSLFGHAYGRAITGEVRMHGEVIATNTVPDAIRHKMAYCTEAVSYTHLDVYKRQVPGVSPIGGPSHHASARWWPGPWESIGVEWT